MAHASGAARYHRPPVMPCAAPSSSAARSTERALCRGRYTDRTSSVKRLNPDGVSGIATFRMQSRHCSRLSLMSAALRTVVHMSLYLCSVHNHCACLTMLSSIHLYVARKSRNTTCLINGMNNAFITAIDTVDKLALCILCARGGI